MVEPHLVHLFLDTPLYMVADQSAGAVAETAEEPVALTVVEVKPAPAKLNPLPQVPGGALFLIDRPETDPKVEHAALEMIHKIGAAMKFSPEQIWIEAASFSGYELTETALASCGAKVALLMGQPLPVKEQLGVAVDFYVRKLGKMALVATPKPEDLLPDRNGRNALWQALKVALGL